MTRSMVSAALDVCSVPRTRWPVSAAVMAMLIVSRSRISPTRITSGSSRRAARRAIAKEPVSVPISRWFTRESWWLCRYSMGSSRVRICTLFSLLIRSIMAARVVDLPLPVGPVTRTRPSGFLARWARISGRPSSLKVGMRVLSRRMTRAVLFLCLKAFTLTLALPGSEKEKSSSP